MIFRPKFHLLFLGVVLVMVGCASETAPPLEDINVFSGATIIDGTGGNPLSDGVIVVREGRIEAIGSADSVQIPEGAQNTDLSGKIVVPGLINAHGHVGETKGLEAGPQHYSEENVKDQLGLYARYGVTTVLSLGGDQQEGIQVRDSQSTPSLDRARLYVAGGIVTADTPEEARKQVDDNAAMQVDFIKIRVDDNLGTGNKMTPEVYQAVIDQAHQHNIPLAAHFYYLEDGKALLRAGADLLAHSARDMEVDEEFMDLLKEKDVCLCPTLVREVSTFVYEEIPEFFDDPFFQTDADPAILEQLKDPERQTQIRNSRAAQTYKKSLEMASVNLKKLVDGGVRIAFGTDSGPPARFQGYFEHIELDLMEKAGLSPMQILVSATGEAARCIGLGTEVGTLEAGKWADFLVLSQDPLSGITNSKSLESVWISGNQVPGR